MKSSIFMGYMIIIFVEAKCKEYFEAFVVNYAQSQIKV